MSTETLSPVAMLPSGGAGARWKRPAPATVLDVSRLLHSARYATPTGIDRVELAYARHLLRCPTERVRFVAAVHGAPRAVPRAVVAQFVAATESVWRDGTRAAWREGQRRLACLGAHAPQDGAVARDGVRQALALGVALRAAVQAAAPPPRNDEIYVNVSHTGIERQTLARWLAGQRALFLLHDMIPIRFPHYVRPGADARHTQRLAAVRDRAVTVLVNSNETGSDLRAHFAAADSPANLAATTFNPLTAPLGVEETFRAAGPAFRASRPYFVCVATIEPRKNHIFLLQMWRRLWDALGDRAPSLVLVGRRGWENENAIDLIERGFPENAALIETGCIPDRLMAPLIRGARAVLLPSFAEGCGLPVLESLALGTPVIASDLPALRESGGAAAEYLDPLDGRGWMEAVRNYAEEGSARRRHRAALAASRTIPDWRGHFRAFRQAIAGQALRTAEFPLC